MENIISALTELKDINSVYGLSVEYIDDILGEISEAKVCTPIIGKFSSGKSALVNTLLGYSRKVLKEDITPETAVPAEIVFSGDRDYVRLYMENGNCEEVELEEYRRMETDAKTVAHVRIGLQNPFLEKIPDVMIVDMPGFESGFEIHNKAIDNYLPKSLVYIVAFPADDLIVRASVGNILKELVLNKMPICVVVTKYDKCNDAFEETLCNLKENLKRYIGDREIKICLTSSYTGEADEVKEFLGMIQEQSQGILSRKFQSGTLCALDNTESYLKTLLKSEELSESGLDEEEEKIVRQLNVLEDGFMTEKDEFDTQTADIVEEIKMDVKEALEAEEPTFVAMTMNKQSINDHLNTVVRNTVNTSVSERLIPKMERYLKRVKKCFNGEGLGDVCVNFHYDLKESESGITTSVVAIVAGLVLGAPVLGLIAAGIMAFLNKQKEEKQREEMRSEIRMKLQAEVYPQIMREVEHGIRTAVTGQIKLMNTSIEDELARQRSTLEKAMTDVRARIDDEKKDKEQYAIGIQNDLAKLKELRDLILQ
ncbi:MAG: dynamin family protein [Lachnospiraceae bacterium]|nr:dynamin family protein [Lachnospiraceae bacterium]